MADHGESRIANSTPQFGRMGRPIDELSTQRGDAANSSPRPMRGKCLDEAFAKEPLTSMPLRTPLQPQKASPSAPSGSPPKRPVAGLNTPASDNRRRGQSMKTVQKSSRRNSSDGDSTLVHNLKREVHTKDQEIVELRRICEAQANELNQFRSESCAETEILKGRMSALERLLELSGDPISPSPPMTRASPPKPPGDGTKETLAPDCIVVSTSDSSLLEFTVEPLRHSSSLCKQASKSREKSLENNRFTPTARRRTASAEVAENRVGLCRSPSNTNTRAPVVSASFGGSGTLSPRQSVRSIGTEARMLRRSMSGTSAALQPIASCAPATSGGLFSPRAAAMSSPVAPSLVANAGFGTHAWPAVSSSTGNRVQVSVARPLSPSKSLSSCARANAPMIAPTAGSPQAPRATSTWSAPLAAVAVQSKCGSSRHSAIQRGIKARPSSPGAAHCG